MMEFAMICGRVKSKTEDGYIVEVSHEYNGKTYSQNYYVKTKETLAGHVAVLGRLIIRKTGAAIYAFAVSQLDNQKAVASQPQKAAKTQPKASKPASSQTDNTEIPF